MNWIDEGTDWHKCKTATYVKTEKVVQHAYNLANEQAMQAMFDEAQKTLDTKRLAFATKKLTALIDHLNKKNKRNGKGISHIGEALELTGGSV